MKLDKIRQVVDEAHGYYECDDDCVGCKAEKQLDRLELELARWRKLGHALRDVGAVINAMDMVVIKVPHEPVED